MPDIHTLLLKLPRWLYLSSLFFIAFFRYIYSFFTSSLFGTFILLMGIYLFLPVFTSIEPYNFYQLLDWFDDLPNTYKATLVSSSLTIIGFLVAFHIASVNWRNKMVAEIKLAASNEMEELVTELSRALTNVEIYCDQVISAFQILHDQNAEEFEKLSRVRYVIRRLPEFEQAQQIVYRSSMEFQRLLGKHTIILFSVSGATKLYNKLLLRMSQIMDRLWVQLPLVDLEDDNIIEDFESSIILDEYSSLAEICRRNSSYLPGIVGAIRGKLIAPLIRTKLAFLTSMVSGIRILNAGHTILRPENNDEDDQ